MEIKEFKVQIPEGMEIDKENSTFECIKFKPKSLTYDDISKSLFKDKSGYFIYEDGSIKETQPVFTRSYGDLNNATSKKQLKKLLAINKLMNVAKYLNEDWKPNWEDSSNKWFIYIKEDKIGVCPTIYVSSDIAYFKFGSLAQRAIDILGEETIRLALSTDW